MVFPIMQVDETDFLYDEKCEECWRQRTKFHKGTEKKRGREGEEVIWRLYNDTILQDVNEKEMNF